MAKPRTKAEIQAALDEANAKLADRPDEFDQLTELYRIRESLWAHLNATHQIGSQKLGIGAIAQLVKVVAQIAELEGESNAEEEMTVADALAEARARRAADGGARATRRGTKSAR